jgi:hypothetical protein
MLTPAYTDLQIQFRMAVQQPEGSLATTHEVRATIDGGGGWRGESTVDLAALGTLDGDPAAYGRRLGELLLPQQVMSAFARARGVTDRPVRIRLLLEMGANGERQSQHFLRWERAMLALNGQTWPLAIAPALPFSRYIPTESVDPDLSGDSVLRLLVAFASPTGLPPELHPVEVESDLSALLDELAPLVRTRRFKLTVLPGRTGVSGPLRDRLTELGAEVLEGSTRKETIGDALNQCQGLHLVAHGTYNAATGRGAVLLEDAKGGRAFAVDDDLNAWIGPGLRFVFLQSCQSAAPTPGQPPFVGIGPTLVRLGVPAVVAMQDFVPMDDARVFAAAFYRSLMRAGVVDTAVNEARQAIFRKKQDDSYSIPVLFMRLRNGLLWQPDPLRNAVRARMADLEEQQDIELPLRAVLSLRRSLDYDTEAGPAGALFDMPAKLAEVAQAANACVLLVGPRGMAKGAQLRSLYRDCARRFLDDETAAPAPVLLTCRQILDTGSVAAAIDQALAKDADVTRVEWDDRELLLIVDGDEDVGEDRLADVLGRLKEFQQRQRRRMVFSLDERSRDRWDFELEPTAILVARPMQLERVLLFLKQMDKPEAQQLCEVIELRQCRDIAGVPWLLDRMIALARRKVTFDSRATLLSRIAGECLTSVSSAGIPRQCAERALEHIAWHMLSNRETALGGAELYEVLSRARGNREFRLIDLQELLIRSGVLATAGEDAVRIRYQSLMAYYAAQHLMRVPAAERQHLLEDITASLGRLARARWWEKTLITLTGLDVRGREHIISTILAGSPLVEGEQLYIAARCYTDSRDPKKPPDGVVDQIADALIWRSHPGNLRPYSDRRRAALALAEIRHPNAVPHFVSLATDQLAQSWGGGKRYELSGMRLIATNGLVLMREAATEYVNANRPELAAVMNAWWEAYQTSDLEPLIRELNKIDPATSPIAAFAIGLFDSEPAKTLLLGAFDDERMYGDLGWAIADTFAMLDPTWVAGQVVEPRLHQFEDPRIPYLIGRTGMTGEQPQQHQYLKDCFSRGTIPVQARAIRALGELKDDTVRELCEAIVMEDWDAVRRLGLTLAATPGPEDLNRLRNAALEALRDVGNPSSIETLRIARQQPSMSITFRQLTFDVAEDIYWRVTGGLSKETFDPQEKAASR